MTPTPPDIPAPQPSEPADADLVARARQGDTDAFGVLVRRYFDRVFGLVVNMLGRREDAEDVAQTVFIRAYRALNRFRGDATFSTWLYRIAVNTASSALARRRRSEEVSLDDDNGDGQRSSILSHLEAPQSPLRDVIRHELQAQLNAALQRLSESHRIVVVLHDIEGLQHDEIARILGVPVGTVRSRLFYARQQLQKELSEFAP